MATSELNQFLENVDEKVLECTICFKRLQNHKSLNCLHSFCLACLEDWVKTKGELICPTCSKSYPIPEGGLQKLPPNTFLNKLIETIDQFSKKDPIKCACKKGEAQQYTTARIADSTCALLSDEGTAMLSSETLITALKDRIKELPKTEPDDNGHINSLVNKEQKASLKEYEMGTVTQRAADFLTLKGEESVTEGQTIVVKIIKPDECKVHANQLKAK
ncbi:E3 ubiquitin-protein ligase TRIM31-like, partial [Anneissia japonica]|uniref:E3 ubiquitin-protein ligase TRIM31-like n=1 Tax=Anneissia japonica TaxID=1529436 RepID=UPI001425AE53